MPPTYNAFYNGSYMYVYQDCTATYISAPSHSRKQHNLYVIFFRHYIILLLLSEYLPEASYITLMLNDAPHYSTLNIIDWCIFVYCA